MPAADAVEIRDNADARRFEAWVDGRVAGFVDYEPAEGRLVLVHTEVDPAFTGRGIGNRLATSVLDELRRRGLGVTPRCPFIAAFIRAHPAYRPLVVGVRGTRIARPSHDEETRA
jgi:uncharacterized protein